MNLIKGRMRLFCVSNIIVSFACTGFLGPRYYNDSLEVGQSNNSMDQPADEVIPLSQLGEGEKNIIEELATLPDINNIIKEVGAKQNKQVQKAKTTTKKSTVTKSVVTKKEVSASSKYTPAVYSEVTGNAVIEYAKRYMGLRYVSAGNSLSTGTDCSGFTRLIYKEFGVSLPRTVSGQISKGTYVKKSDLQKGDLVFYSSGGRYATHVGMYMGNGLVIHESNPRDGVKISSVNMMHYITARRVINNTAKKIAEQKQEEEKNKENILATDTKEEVKDSNTSINADVNTNNTNASTNVNIDTSLNNVNNANTESISETKEIQNAETVNQDTSTNSSNKTDESKLIMDSKKDDSSVTNTKEEVKENTTETKTENAEEKKEVTEVKNVEEPKIETTTTAEVSKEEVKQEPTETKEESLENTEK